MMEGTDKSWKSKSFELLNNGVKMEISFEPDAKRGEN